MCGMLMNFQQLAIGLAARREPGLHRGFGVFAIGFKADNGLVHGFDQSTHDRRCLVGDGCVHFKSPPGPVSCIFSGVSRFDDTNFAAAQR